MARIDHFHDPHAPKANSMVPSVTVVVSGSDGTILLVHKTDNGLWALPGGGIDIGESVTQAAVREVKEETGITVETTGIVGIYSDPHHVMAYDDGEVRQQFSICLTARMLAGALRPSEETSEVEFVPTSTLDDRTIHPSMRMRIDHYLQNRAQPYLG